MNQQLPSPTNRLHAGRILRWVRYVCLLALALLIGYVSRDWSRPPIWKKRVPVNMMIAGVSEARNEIVFVSQFDQNNEPFDGREMRKIKKDAAPNSPPPVYESASATKLAFYPSELGRPVVPKTITIETCDLRSGVITKSLNIQADNIYNAAGLNERTVTLVHSSGGILQIDRATGATITNQSFLGYVSLGPTGEQWWDRNRVHSTKDHENIYEPAVESTSSSISGFAWSPDGSKLASVVIRF